LLETGSNHPPKVPPRRQDSLKCMLYEKSNVTQASNEVEHVTADCADHEQDHESYRILLPMQRR
jgi:hypothetical protein